MSSFDVDFTSRGVISEKHLNVTVDAADIFRFRIYHGIA